MDNCTSSCMVHDGFKPSFLRPLLSFFSSQLSDSVERRVGTTGVCSTRWPCWAAVMGQVRGDLILNHPTQAGSRALVRVQTPETRHPRILEKVPARKHCSWAVTRCCPFCVIPSKGEGNTAWSDEGYSATEEDKHISSPLVHDKKGLQTPAS